MSGAFNVEGVTAEIEEETQEEGGGRRRTAGKLTA